MMLYYNCARPLEVLRSGVIKVSKVTQVARGVSLSDSFHMASHGPFKIAYNNPAWEKQLKRVLYLEPIRRSDLEVPGGKRRLAGPVIAYEDQFGKRWTVDEYYSLQAARIAKNSMFQDECEWWSPIEIRFRREEVARIYFMTNAPKIFPKVAEWSRRQLRLDYPEMYEEIQVNDPYLERT